MDVSIRSTEMELMDAPDLDIIALQLALADINRCNRWLGGLAISFSAVDQLIKNHPKKSYTILDVGCGDGFMLRKLAQRLQERGIAVKLVGVDVNENILAIAREKSEGMANITYHNTDVFAAGDTFNCDILLCTLTLHHIDESEIPQFLKQCATLAKLGVVINDLQRSPIAHLLFKMFSFVFLRSPVARNDGLVSIRRGFQKQELNAWAQPLHHYRHNIRWKWAFRYLWIIQPV